MKRVVVAEFELVRGCIGDVMVELENFKGPEFEVEWDGSDLITVYTTENSDMSIKRALKEMNFVEKGEFLERGNITLKFHDNEIEVFADGKSIDFIRIIGVEDTIYNLIGAFKFHMK